MAKTQKDNVMPIHKCSVSLPVNVSIINSESHVHFYPVKGSIVPTVDRCHSYHLTAVYLYFLTRIGWFVCALSGVEG